MFHELSAQLPDNALLACDVGSATNWYARYLKIRPGMVGSVSGGLASMGNGLPYLLAGKFCYPDRPAIAMVGDGAMQMLGNIGLTTLAKYWREWDDPRAIVLVLNNQDLNQVSWEQRIMEGEPKVSASQDLPDFAYDEYAELLGLTGLAIRTPHDIAPTWKKALAADRPVVINAYTDPEVPTLPPHITPDLAQGYLMSMLKGDPDAWHTIKQSMKTMGARLRVRARSKMVMARGWAFVAPGLVQLQPAAAVDAVKQVIARRQDAPQLKPSSSDSASTR